MAAPAAIDLNTIVVTARQGPPRGDPIAVVNEVSFVAVQAVDKAFVAPVAYGYQRGLPEPIRDGIHNALNNLDEPIVLLNFLLQFKIGKAVETEDAGGNGSTSLKKSNPCHSANNSVAT